MVADEELTWTPDPDPGAAVLDEIQRRVLWLATRMIDHANRVPPGPDGIKVGGHQASCASMVTLMTALWFDHLRAEDRVAVKPHAAPVLHAINYLLSDLDPSYLTQLRQYGGLQAYPSRTKDPDRVDFSTGSVGLGAVAPLFAAAVHRYLDAHEPTGIERRYIAVIGDAELDEGNVWEAVLDPALEGLGNVLLVVDCNRQSLDRIVPGIKEAQLRRMFEANGWHAIEAKYGQRLQQLATRDGGEAFRAHIDAMSNERYQRLLRWHGPELRAGFLEDADAQVHRICEELDDKELRATVTNLGGHDLAELRRAYREADEISDRPSVVFAYTIKGWQLPNAGDPMNHAALLDPERIEQLRNRLRIGEDHWARLPDGSPAARHCEEVAARLQRPTSEQPARIEVPIEVGLPPRARSSTQDAFGRLLARLADDDRVRPYMVTASPDVSISTNLGGWINKVGVFDHLDDPPPWPTDGVLRWERSTHGQHLELGISEMNLFSLLGALGAPDLPRGRRLLPIGTLYDPFVCRGLDALIQAVYGGARFLVVGTPSGITLSPEGGAHQSIITPSLGAELPGLVAIEPGYVTALDWLLTDALATIADPEGPPESVYLRLSTRTISQEPFEAAIARIGRDELRRQVLAGAYRLVDGRAIDGPQVHLFATGAVLPEVIEARSVLADEGVAASVFDVTSMDRLHRSWRASVRTSVASARSPGACHLDTLLGHGARHVPIVTVVDGASHALSWLGAAFGAPVVPLGVDRFGESGSREALYAAHDLSPDAIVNAALAALTRC